MLKAIAKFLALALIWVPLTHADVILNSVKPDPTVMGIGTLTRSNQIDYERFEGAFYLEFSPLSLERSSISSQSETYTTQFDSNHPSGIMIGVRHDVSNFNRVSLFGDYGLGVNWMSGKFSARDFRVSSSSSTSELLSLTLSPKLLVGYFVSDVIQPFIGFGASLIYSRLESPLSGGSNEFLETHYGPLVGIQVLNFPLKQLFFSIDYSLSLNQSPSDQRLYVDNGRVELALGLTF